MFFFIPIIIIITLIRLAVDVKPAFLVSPYSNNGLALTIVFGVGPFVVALGSYLSQYFSVKDPERYSYYQRFALLLPYLVFASLIYPQSFNVVMAEGTVPVTGGGWLYSALAELTNGFDLVRPSFDLIDPSSSIQSYYIYEFIALVLKHSAYYVVFFLYLIVSDGFLKKGKKDFSSHLPVDFMSIVRQGILGLVFIFIFIFAEKFEEGLKGYILSLGFTTQSEALKLIVASISSALILFVPMLFIYFLPLILPRVAGWKVLPAGEYHDLLSGVAKANRFKYNKIYLANKPGLITAGIIGYFPRTRNLVFTRDILNLLNADEIEAVMLHEIGHAKYKHIFIYYLFFIGLIFLVGLFDVVLQLLPFASIMSEAFLNAFPYLILIAGIRFGWGWVSRNCERQADLFAAETQKTPEHLVTSFYKISDILGGVLEKPSWHHGSLKTRIDYLETAFLPNSGVVPKQHHRFVLKIKSVVFMAFILFFSLTTFDTYHSYKSQLGKFLYMQNQAMNKYQLKRYAEASTELKKTLDYLYENLNLRNEIHEPGYSQLVVNTLYNLSCVYALQGEKDLAFEALFQLMPKLDRSLVLDASEKLNTTKFLTDQDFDNIRDDQRFKMIIAMIKSIESDMRVGEPNPYSALSM